jgi:hypothetical protein
MAPQEFCANLDLTSLEGAKIDAYAQDEGYWHLFVALRIDGNGTVLFTTEENSAGPRFEVFPLKSQHEVGVERKWRSLPAPLLVCRATPLWRSEWLESGAVGEFLGSNPATHYAGRGPVPSEAVAGAHVRAGVLLQSASGVQLVVSASNTAPFNVEIFFSHEAVSKALAGFQPMP